MMTVTRYTPGDAPRWDALVADSRAGTFLHSRRFLEYHGSRFEDHSLLFSEGERLCGVLPLALDPDDRRCVVSHPGATYGGLVLASRRSGMESQAALVEACRYLVAQGFSRLRYKSVPSHLHPGGMSQVDLLLLWQMGARLYRRDLWNVLELSGPVQLTDGRSYQLKRARSQSLHVRQENTPAAVASFYEVLKGCLEDRHGVAPVHSVEEMLDLHARFPDDIALWRVEDAAGACQAGIWLFRHGRAWHQQYAVATPEGREAGAQDFLMDALLAQARQEGVQVFSFGASTEQEGRVLNEGLFRFKAGFGGGSVIQDFHELDLHDARISGTGSVPQQAVLLQRRVPRLQDHDCGFLAEPLKALVNLANAELRFGEEPTVADLVAADGEARRELAQWLAAHPAVAGETLIDVAATLFRRAEQGLWYWTFFADVSPFERDERYGALDPYRFQALHRAWMRVVADLAAWTLELDPHAPVAATAAGLLADSCVRLAKPQLGLQVLETARQTSAEPAFALALERCHLVADAPRAAEQVRARAGLPAGIAHPLRLFPNWACAEGFSPATLFADAERAGHFEMVCSDGRVRRCDHVVPAESMQLVRARDLRLRATHLLAGPQGTILRPRPYVQTGEFPYGAPEVLARVTGGDVAVTLAARANWQRVDAPVFVLDHMVIGHGNYYHWLLETVSRLAWAENHGLIGERLVLVPAGTPLWMQQALELVGIGPARQLLYAPDDALHLQDASVLSCVDFSSRSLLVAMRERFLRAAGVVPVPAAERRWLFLTRRGNDNRQLLNLDEAEELARAAGFEVVAPETLDVAGQVRLFASAAGIAGLEGAAFTNQVFAPPGIRVLSLSSEDDNEPTFVNLSILLDQPRRCLLGETPAQHLVVGQNAAAYRLQPELLAAGLAWVKEKAGD